MINTFKSILIKAKESGRSLQIPFRFENGVMVDEELFGVLEYIGDTPIKVIEQTEEKLVLEITNEGVCNIIKEFNLEME